MSKPKILTVDDEAFNLDILGEYLSDADYEVIVATDGQEALEKLEAHPDIDVIVLDRMMPRMDGMTFMSHVKDNELYAAIPVIMQTAAASEDQIKQGIEAGVFYYLTKPYEETVLLSLVRSALEEHRQKKELREELKAQKRVVELMQSARFQFRTLTDARQLAVHIANAFPNPENVVYGLSELMINAVEHGNLGITYEDKTRLVLSNRWHAEVAARLSLPENAKRFAVLELEASDDAIIVTISDQGQGFDYESYLELSPERATDPHGRGIATACGLSFDEVTYLGSGNQVRCRVGRVP